MLENIDALALNRTPYAAKYVQFDKAVASYLVADIVPQVLSGKQFVRLFLELVELFQPPGILFPVFIWAF